MGKKIANVRHNPYLMGEEVDFRHVPEKGLRIKEPILLEIASRRNALCQIPWQDRYDVKARKSGRNRNGKAPAIPEDNSDGEKGDVEDLER